ncbi:MFS transporter [Sphingopyxis terrae]|uniref:MFS transporter n=1 Tax=Sphingopyxis terrae TaxID=33052 RepID=UPI002A0EC88B|nr:MFS transporter [Sphingopyxis terrae]MDX8356486.1 hypothetical protein [Sphingopyxis terrae]
MSQASTAHFQSGRTIVLSLLIGTGGLTIFGIMPIILGGLLNAGRLNAAQLGWAATAETLAMALGLLIGARVLTRASTRWIVVLAGVVMAAANFWTIAAPAPWSILVSRGAAGLSEGILIAVTALSIAFSPVPARLSGIFLTVSVPPPLLLAYTLPVYIMPRYGYAAGFIALALVGLICAVAAAFIRDDLAHKLDEGRRRVRWTFLTGLALGGILLSSAGFAAAWAYVDPLAVSHALSPAEIGTAVTATIAGQFLISLFVASYGWRMPMILTLVAMSAAQAALALALIWAGTPLGFALALASFGLLWQGAVPFATALLVAIDDSRALAPLFFPIQLIGMAIGPFLASFVAGSGVAGVLVLAAALFGLTVVIYIMVGRVTARANITLPRSVQAPA